MLLASLKFNSGTGHQQTLFHLIVVLIAFEFTLSQALFVEGKDHTNDGLPEVAPKAVLFQPRREKVHQRENGMLAS